MLIWTRYLHALEQQARSLYTSHASPERVEGQPSTPDIDSIVVEPSTTNAGGEIAELVTVQRRPSSHIVDGEGYRYATTLKIAGGGGHHRIMEYAAYPNATGS